MARLKFADYRPEFLPLSDAEHTILRRLAATDSQHCEAIPLDGAHPAVRYLTGHAKRTGREVVALAAGVVIINGWRGLGGLDGVEWPPGAVIRGQGDPTRDLVRRARLRGWMVVKSGYGRWLRVY